MIKTKEELAKKIKPLCEKVLFNKEKSNNVLHDMQASFNIPTGMTMDLLTGRINLEDANEFILFALTNCLDKELEKKNTDKFFTPIEINGYSDSKYQEETIKFPIEIKCIPVTPDQWIGSIDVDFIMKLRKAQLINYNANAQRTLQKVVKGERSYYKITLNKDAINKISESMNNGNYIPNTITLNMPETADFSYDDSKNILSIKSLDHFDISDGYHRYIAMAQLKDKNPDFNYPMELRIVMFSEDKVKQFIYQEDQKTKMRKIDSDSMNMNAPENLVVERLNRDVMFNLKNKIARNNGSISYGELAAIIRYFYFKGQNADKSVRKIIEVENDIRDNFNKLTEAYPDLLDKDYSFTELMIIFHAFDEKMTIEHTFTLLNKVNEIDSKIFATKIPRKGMISAINQLERK